MHCSSLNYPLIVFHLFNLFILFTFAIYLTFVIYSPYWWYLFTFLVTSVHLFCYLFILFVICSRHMLSTHHIYIYTLYTLYTLYTQKHTQLWLCCQSISPSPSLAIQAASSQSRAFWFVLQLRPPLKDSGTVETIFTESYSTLLRFNLSTKSNPSLRLNVDGFDFQGVWDMAGVVCRTNRYLI